MPHLRFAVILAFALAGCAAGADRPLPEQIDAVFRDAHEDGEFDGSVLVVRDGATVYERSFGLADDAGTPNAAATRFLGYSLTKPLTAILVFQQIDAGVLALDDRLDEFFPNLAGKAAGPITLRQLLTHTSGINEIISAHRDRRIAAADLETATVREPGSMQYSSTGFVCLALVLEAVTGRGYAELLEEKILRPAGMKDSGPLRSGVAVPGLAAGHRIDSGRRVPAPLDVAPEVLDGAGTLYTTTADLARLDQALSAATILSARLQAQMLEEQVKGRGFGWSLDEQGGKYFPWHQGSYRGFTAVLVRQIHRHEMIAILSNVEDTDVLGLRTQVLRLLKRDAAATPR